MSLVISVVAAVVVTARMREASLSVLLVILHAAGVLGSISENVVSSIGVLFLLGEPGSLGLVLDVLGSLVVNWWSVDGWLVDGLVLLWHGCGDLWLCNGLFLGLDDVLLGFLGVSYQKNLS